MLHFCKIKYLSVSPSRSSNESCEQFFGGTRNRTRMKTTLITGFQCRVLFYTYKNEILNYLIFVHHFYSYSAKQNIFFTDQYILNLFLSNMLLAFKSIMSDFLFSFMTNSMLTKNCKQCPQTAYQFLGLQQIYFIHETFS